MADTFISYSRQNGLEAESLAAHLRLNELEPWLDTDADRIAAGIRWSDEIAKAIEDAGSLVVIVTPHSLSSREVSREVEHARHQGKPIIPLILSLPDDAVDSESAKTPKPIKFEELPNWVADYQIIDTRQGDLPQAFDQVVSSVRKDYHWRSIHAELLGRARNWNSGKGSLLSDHDLEKAGQWLEQVPAQSAKPTDLQRSFIRASHEAQQHRRAEKADRLAELILAGFYDPDLALPLALENVNVNIASPRAVLALDRALRSSLNQRAVISIAKPNEIQMVRCLDDGTLIMGYGYNHQYGFMKHPADGEPMSGNIGNLRAINGKGMMVIEDGGIIKLADTRADEVERLKYYLPSGLAAADFDSTGNLLLTVDHHGQAWLWDMEQRKPTLELAPAESTGKKITAKMKGRKPEIDKDGGLRGNAPPGDGPITATLSDDGRYAAVAYDLGPGKGDSVIAVYDTSNGRRVLNLGLGEWAVTSMRFRPGHHDLLYVYDGEAFLQPLPKAAAIRLAGGVSGIDGAFVGSPDGRVGAIVGNDGFVRIIDLETRGVMETLGGHDFRAEIGPVFSGSARIITGLLKGTLRIWNIGVDGAQKRIDMRQCPAAGEIIYRDPGLRPLVHVSISPDGKLLCSVAQPLQACVWNLADLSKLSRIHPTPATQENHLAWLADGSFVAIPYEHNPVQQQYIYHYFMDKEDCDSKLLLSRDTAEGEEEPPSDPFEYHHYVMSQGHYTGLSVSADGQRLAVQVSGYNPAVEVWQLKPLKRLLVKTGGTLLSLSADGHSLLLTDDEIGYRLWSVDKDSRIKLPPIEVKNCHQAVWAPQGKLFALVHGSLITIIDADGKREPLVLPGHRARVFSIAFCPKAEMLVSGAQDGSLRVWNINSGQELRRLDLPGYAATTVCFTPDGASVVSGYTDSFVRIWRLWPLDELKAFAEEKSVDLSQADRRRFGLLN